ncbi:MAG: hypothetical protein AAFU77_01005 [Myxococcota bacterium]
MAHAIFIAAVLSANPGTFEDTHNGFRVELPKGWRHSKSMSAPERTVFQKTLSGRRNRGAEGTLTITQKSVPSAIGLTGVYTQRLEAVRRCLRDLRLDTGGRHFGSLGAGLEASEVRARGVIIRRCWRPPAF